MANDNFNLVDFFNAFRNRKTYDKYTQDGLAEKTNYSEWASADANNDGKLNIKDGQKLEERYNKIANSKNVYDLTQDEDVKFDDLFAFSESMDVNGDGTVCGLEKEFLQGKTKLVYAQVKENLDNNQNLKLSDLMDYSKAVSNLDSGKKSSLSNEIATLESTMINKLRTRFGSDYDINGTGAKGDINDLTSFWQQTAGASNLNLGHGSQLMDFLDETETGLRSNVKKNDSSMNDQRLDTMKQDVQSKVLADSAESTPKYGFGGGCESDDYVYVGSLVSDDCGCSGTGSTAGAGSTSGSTQTGGTSQAGQTSGTTQTGGTSNAGYAGTFDYEVRDRASSMRFIQDKLGFNENEMQSVEYDSEGRVSFFEKKCGFVCRHNQKENYTLCYDCDKCEITVIHDDNGNRDTSVYKHVAPTPTQPTRPTCPCEPTPDPTPTVCPTPDPTPTVCPTPDPTPTVCPTPDPTPTVCPTPDPTPTVCPTPDPTPTVCPTPDPAPTIRPPRPRPRPVTPQPVVPQNNVTIDVSVTEYNNNGIIDGPGDDIYAINYSVNTYNVTNNYNSTVITPTVEPTIEPTPTPTVEPTIEPTPTPTVEPTIEPTTTPTLPPPDPEAPSTPTIDLMPLRNLLTTIEAMNPDGILSDNEIKKAINDPRYSDIDGDPSTNSAEELAIYNKIKEFNENKELISNVIMGDYSDISEETLNELVELSRAVKQLTGR